MAEWEVVVAAIPLTLEPRATPLHYFVHVLYLVSIERKILSAIVALGGGFSIHLSLDT